MSYMKMALFSGIVALLLVRPVDGQNSAGFWECPREFQGQHLNVYNWTTYIAEDTISNFEELCGVTVTYNTYASDTDMQAELEQGNTPHYDVVVPTDGTVYLLISENLLQPLDLSRIPNFANVTPRLKNPPYDPDNHYTVPYQWGTVGIGYNQTKVGKAVTSWNDLFTYKGPVDWLDDERAMLGIALRLLGSDPNTDQPDQVAKARDWLMANAANLKVIAPDDGQDRLFKGEADMVVEYSGDIFHIMADCKCNDFNYVIPKEGTRVWVDNLAIPVGAANPALAAVFIDYILDPQVGADISNFTAYASPNQAAIDGNLIDERYLTNLAIYPDAATAQNLFYIKSSEQLEPIYAQDWDQLKATLKRNP